MFALIRRRKGAPTHAPWEDLGTRYAQSSTAQSLAGKRANPGYDVWEVPAVNVPRMTQGSAPPAAKTSASARPVARG